MSEIIEVSSKPLTLERANKIIDRLRSNLHYPTWRCNSCQRVRDIQRETQTCVECDDEICDSCCKRVNPDRKNVEYRCSDCA